MPILIYIKNKQKYIPNQDSAPSKKGSKFTGPNLPSSPRYHMIMQLESQVLDLR